jgi:secreted trypsin-like serine protease
MNRLRLFGSLVAVAALLGGCGVETSSDTQSDDLVGGSHDSAHRASGYLVHGSDMSSLNLHPACGATLIAPNVIVTAAHCITESPDDTWAFGTGDVSLDNLIAVRTIVTHPEFHPAPTGSLGDVHYYLRNNDVAYAILETSVDGVSPAELSSAKPSMGCKYTATGYNGSSHMRTSACVEFNVSLGDDPIFEVHPSGSSALCQRDGDEGSPLVTYNGASTTLYGFYVGSVTAGLTDCRKGTQFLDGYESAAGFADFFEEGIARGAAEPD